MNNSLNEVLIQLGDELETSYNQIVIIVSESGTNKGIIQNKLGVDISFDIDDLKTFSLKSNILKQVYIENGIHSNVSDAIIKSHKDRKPNLILNITLQTISTLDSISTMLKSLGYYKDNIHIVWWLNDTKVIINKNVSNVHHVVSFEMKLILSGVIDISEYMDGTFHIIFNPECGTQNHLKLKDKNKPLIMIKDMDDNVLSKITSLVPDKSIWTR